MAGAAEQWLLLLLLLLLCRPPSLRAQFPRDSPQYLERMAQQDSLLLENILFNNTELNTYLHPESALLANDGYRFDYPITTIYRINIIVDPCRFLRADCCMNVYGVAEYPSMLRSGLEPERQVVYPVIGNETGVGINYALIYEDASPVPPANSRFADDHTEFNTTCRAYGVPYDYCQGKNYAYVRSPYRPACLDYNQTLDVSAGCTGPDNVTRPFCVAVGFTQTAFIPQCGIDNGHCGTYLEVHIKTGTPYAKENFPIASVKIDSRNVSGYSTVVLPLTYGGALNKVLCAYTESKPRVGSIVYINPTAPVCCCPTPYKPATRFGSWECPVGPAGAGSTGTVPKNIAETLLTEAKNNAYPFCPNDVSSRVDYMMYSDYDEYNQRNYLREAKEVWANDTSGPLRLGTNAKTGALLYGSNFVKYGSRDLNGWDYDGVCPYYKGCAITTDNGLCKGGDVPYHFIGKIGIVTSIDTKSLIPTVRVSFNAGRTDYQFLLSDVKLEVYKSMYEIWWVVKTPVENVVQKRKGFNVTNPTCTLDTTNQRYFPYALLSLNQTTGVPILNSKGKYQFIPSGTSFE